MIILQRPHQCLMHHVVRYVVVAASRVRAGAARAAPMGARPCVPQTSAVGLTHVKVQWRVGSFQLQALNTIARVSQTLNTCGPRGCASELSSKRSKSFQTLCAVCTYRRPACRRPLLGVIQTMLLLTIA